MLAKDNPRSNAFNEEFYKMIIIARDEDIKDGYFIDEEARRRFEKELEIEGRDFLKEYNEYKSKISYPTYIQKIIRLLRKPFGQDNGRKRN
jgi:hypothetical protein